MTIIGRDRFHHGQPPAFSDRWQSAERSDHRTLATDNSLAASAGGRHTGAAALTGRTLILIGMEGPNLSDPITEQPFWRPTAANPRWVRLVKQAVVEFLTRNTQDEWRWDAAAAAVATFRNAIEFEKRLKAARYARVVVYSHGDANALMAKIDDWSTHVRAYAIARALCEAGVRQALFLGCNSRGLAESVARIAEGFVRAGGIDYVRQDHVDESKTRLDILNPIIWGYGVAR